MTAAAGHATTGRTGPILPPAGASGAAPTPRLANGVELLGEYQGSGYAQPPSLVRRPDGQVIQMSRLLYQVTCQIYGSRDPGAIADLVSRELDRTLSGDQVRHLITSKLLPLGIVVAEGAPAAPPKATAASLPITCVQTWQTASHMTGFTLPGMIDEPGCRSGMPISSSQVRGPDPISRRSLQIL